MARRLKTDGDLRPMAALTLTEGGARLLSFLFYVLAARELSPVGFGELRYTLTIALIMFFVLQVVAMAAARQLGAARGDREATQRLVGSSVTVTALLLLLTAAVALAAGNGGLLGGVDVWGLIVALVGYTAFQVYYAIARGMGETLRPAFAYLGGSLIQLLAFVGLMVTGLATTGSALAVYGLSSVIPILCCEIWRPILVRSLAPDRGAIKTLLRTAAPLVAGQVAFIVWNSADQIWVQNKLGTRAIGLYGSARNLSQLFIVIPTGVGLVLLPRVAQLRSAGLGHQAWRLTVRSTVAVTSLTAVLAMGVIVERAPLLAALYGQTYRSASGALLLQSIGMVFYAAFATFAGAAIGWGWLRLSVVGTAIAGGAELILLFLLPSRELTTAAASFAISIGLALVVMLTWAYLKSRIPPHKAVPSRA